MLVGPQFEETTSSPTAVMPEPNDELFRQEVRASIQNQYLIAAERGEISKIRGWRIVRGMDQVELALKTNMTQPEISRAERVGQVNRMKGATLKRIAEALQVRVDDLF